MELTFEQKKAILDYISNYSVKAILEDVDEVGRVYTEENAYELVEAIKDFVNSCREQILSSI